MLQNLPMFEENLLFPNWPAPAAIKALVTRRTGGASSAPFNELNLATHVGDDSAIVIENRRRLKASLRVDEICWLNQVHGTRVVEAVNTENHLVLPSSDACWTKTPMLACAIMTADCLPILVCNRAGTRVLAIHAGWRGLVSGVVPSALKKANMIPGETYVWLGPAIGPSAYQVGSEVLEAFSSSSAFEDVDVAQAFTADDDSDTKKHFMCDLYQLVRMQLEKLGHVSIYGGDQCTYSQDKDYFSYRRDGQTGRMASLIWIDR